jgi:hypothetical protein
MKKIVLRITVTLGILSAILAGCSESNTGFLDPDLSSLLNREVVFGDSIYTHQYQASLYRYLGYTYFLDNAMAGGGLWSFHDIADGSRCVWTGTAQASHRWNMNNISDANETRLKYHWRYPYENITRSNIFLANIDNSPLGESKKERLKAETRFIRAWYYFHLLRLYGGTPLMGDKVYGIEEKFEEPRARFEDEVNYIVKECDEIVGKLPAQQTGNDYGRITSGAAMALKAKVLLFAASPLSNGQAPTDDPVLKPILGYENYDVNRWKLAADAAKAIIDLNRYQLIEDNTTAPGYGFYRMQIERVNPEYIFSLMKNNNRYNEELLLPSSRGGEVYSSPYQSVADAFTMDNGKEITDPASGYDDLKMYENRDPRFYYTLLFDGAMWIPRTGSTVKERINFWKGAPTDGVGTSSSVSKTGYLFRKFCNENVSGAAGSNDNVYPFIRYAEILLSYAEALNEYDPQGSKSQIEDVLFQIRRRAGIQPGADNRYGIPASYDQAAMRDLILKERRVELLFEEGHRYFDLKRWKKLAEAKQEVDFYGIEWTDPGQGPQTYNLFILDTHHFDPNKQYYFPIPTPEIEMIGPALLPQNPGW